MLKSQSKSGLALTSSSLRRTLLLSSLSLTKRTLRTRTRKKLKLSLSLKSQLKYLRRLPKPLAIRSKALANKLTLKLKSPRLSQRRVQL